MDYVEFLELRHSDDELMHRAHKYIKREWKNGRWVYYYSRGREKYLTGPGKSVYRRGEGLGTGPVGASSRPSSTNSRRPSTISRSRDKYYSGQGKNIYRRGEGLGIGSVGVSSRPSSESKTYMKKKRLAK